jgi:hypothetical protein
MFFIKVLERSFKSIFIVFIFAKNLLSLFSIIFKYFSINKIYKIEFKLNKSFSSKERNYIYNLFCTSLNIYLIKILVDVDIGHMTLKLSRGIII